MDEERHRISLGMKNSYICDGIDTQTSSRQISDESIERNDSFDDTQLTMSPDSNLAGIQDVDSNSENEEFPILAKVELRASVPPLEVTLDDVEISDMDNIISQDEGHIDDADTINKKNERRANKKAKAERLFYNSLLQYIPHHLSQKYLNCPFLFYLKNCPAQGARD